MITLQTQPLNIPFRQSFSHASASRSQTCSVITTATLNGKVGYGEGCPRPYVTGETIESVLAFHSMHCSSLSKIDSLAVLKSWSIDHQQEIDANPAAFCALELALLDVLSCDRNQTVEQFLYLPEISGSFSYTAVIGLGSLDNFHKQVAQYQQAGFQDYKLKISGDLSEDLRRIQKLQSIGRIRLDANNLWGNIADCIENIQALPNSIFAIEEPLPAKDIDALAAISEATQIPIILDESFTRWEDFDCLPPGQLIINLRLSKMGGMLRSLAIAEEAQRREIPIIVGAQVGETSLLTRAALTLVNSFRDVAIAHEGAFSTHLLQQDPFLPNIKFGQSGLFTFQSKSFRDGLGLVWVEPEY